MLAITACQTGGNTDPAKTVETYLQAKVNRDANTVRRLLCSEMESQYEIEITTFEGVTGVRVENMACARVGQSDRVRCDGKIVADYGTERNEFPLTIYRVRQEDGEWKWCGESE